MQHDRLDQIERLRGAVMVLGPRGLAVLCHIASRLAIGAKEHGDFERLDRNWAAEALDENLDELVYRTVDNMVRAGKL